jgi:hypothetical protein
VHFNDEFFFVPLTRDRQPTSKGGYEEYIEGVGICQEITKKRAKKTSRADVSTLKSMGLSRICRHFIGGPVSDYTPFPILSLKLSKISEDDFLETSLVRVAYFTQDDFSLWQISWTELVKIFSKTSPMKDKINEALIEIRIYWGCARWGRVQLLGEIARGGWGLANPQRDSWEDPATSWEKTVKRAIVAGKNDMSENYVS